MVKIILFMTMLLVDFILDSDGGVQIPYPDYSEWRKSDILRETIQSI